MSRRRRSSRIDSPPERKAALYDVNLNAARETTAEAAANLQQAQDALATATQNVQAPSFAPGSER